MENSASVGFQPWSGKTAQGLEGVHGRLRLAIVIVRQYRQSFVVAVPGTAIPIVGSPLFARTKAPGKVCRGRNLFRCFTSKSGRQDGY